MGGFRTNLSSPTSTKPSVSKKDFNPKLGFSKEEKENQQESPNQMGSRLQHFKKVTSCKHFMSPTATSKAKKKTLVEKNQASSEDLGFLRYPLSSDSYKHDLGSKPYDPLTNYLSPRPRFRMYNPDRRAEVLKSQMFEEMTESLGSPSSSSLQEEDQEGHVFEDDSDEEVDEENDGVLHKVSKFLFVLCALIYATFYISSMNSTTTPISSLYSQWNIKERYTLIQNRSFESPVSDFTLGSVLFNQTEEKEKSLMEETEFVVPGRIAKDDVVEQELERPRKRLVLFDLPHEGEPTAETLKLLDACEAQVVSNSMDETSKMLGNKPVKSWEQNKFSTENGTRKKVTEKDVVNSLDDVEARLTVQGRETEDRTESLQVPGRIENLSPKIDEKRIILGEIVRTCEIDDDSVREYINQTRKVEPIFTVAVAISCIAFLTGLVGYIYRKYRKPCDKDSSPATQAYAQPIVEDGDEDGGGLTFCKKAESSEEKEAFVKTEYNFDPPASFHSEEQRFINLYGSRAPTVELLGEYVVPAKLSRSSSHGSNPTQLRKQGITESNSNGSFTPQEKIVSNEEGSGGEEFKKVSSTSLRRSNRIRSKTVR